MAKQQMNRTGNEALVLSSLAENYLITLYTLEEEEARPITMSRLAEHLAMSPTTEHLGTSLASVAGMVRRMKRDGLLDINSQKEIVFTELGQIHAQALMRRHQLAERLLVDFLGMDLHKVHAEAHRLEHAISPEVESRLAERLGNPPTCPFGHPIPGSGYKVPNATMSLDKVNTNTTVIVERIPEYDPKLVEYLVGAGIVRDNTITVREIAPFKGTMTMDVEGNEIVIGLQVATRIMVRPPTADTP